MTTSRLEAFSDGVLAIVITIMVLEMKAPEGLSWAVLRPVLPKFISYLLSFLYIGIYWNNHHHLFQAIQKINGKVLWANLVLLLSLSLIPFTTAWMGVNHFGKNPVILYGVNLLFCAIAFLILERVSIHSESVNAVVQQALDNNKKEAISISLYTLGILTAFFYTPISLVCYVVVAILWLIPDERIERNLES